MNPVDKPGKTGALMPVEAALQRLLDMAAAAPIREQQVLPWLSVMAGYWPRT